MQDADSNVRCKNPPHRHASPDQGEAELQGPWWQKLAWLVAIWAASVAALGIVAWLLRLVMQGVGLSL